MRKELEECHSCLDSCLPALARAAKTGKSDELRQSDAPEKIGVRRDRSHALQNVRARDTEERWTPG